MGRARRRRAPRSCSPHEDLDFCPPPPALRPPLPAAPAVRAGGADPRREVALLAQRVDAAVRGADGRDPGDAARGRRAGRARDRALAPLLPRPRGAPDQRGGRDRARSRPACACAATCSTRCSPTRWSTTGCAPTRTGSPAATSPTRPPTSRSTALIEAVRGRYELPRRWYRLKAQLLGVDRLADYDRMAAVTDEELEVPWARREGDGARVVRRLRAGDGRHRAGLLRRPPHRRARPPRQARRRVLLLHRARARRRT